MTKQESAGQRRRLGLVVFALGLLALGLVAFALAWHGEEYWWLWKLRSDDRAESHRAAEKLGAMKSVSAVPELVRRLGEEPGELVSRRFDSPTRSLGHEGSGASLFRYELSPYGEALVEIGAPAVPEILRKLRRADPLRRQDLLRVLERLGPRARESIPAVVDILRNAASEPPETGSTDPTARRLACSTLAAIGAESAAYLLESFRPGTVDRFFFPEAFGAIGEPALPHLIEALRKDDEGLRALAVSGASAIGEPAVPWLDEVLRDPDPPNFARQGAAKALGRIGTPAVAALLRALEDEDPQVRIYAVFALCNMSPLASEPAVEAVAERLRDENDTVRFYTASAVARFHFHLVALRPRFEELAADPDPRIREVAAEVLERLSEAR